MTLDRLYSLPVPEAARLALGAAADGYVERVQSNGVQGNYVLGTTNMYGVWFFKRPQAVGPGTCQAVMGRAVFEVPGVDFVLGQSAGTNSPGAVPLKPRFADERTVYFAADAATLPTGPHHADPARSAVAPTGDGCSLPVARRVVFNAKSAEDALATVADLRTIVTAARRSRRLTFAASGVCRDGPCKDPRAALAGLDLGRINSVDQPPCRSVERGAARCRAVWISADVQADWVIAMNEDARGRLISVRFEYAMRPMI